MNTEQVPQSQLTTSSNVTHTSASEWYPIDTSNRAFAKGLWVSSETGRWSVLLRWLAGYTYAKHKHIGAAYAYVLSGRLQVPGAVLESGDFHYEPTGAVHPANTAVEDCDYLFSCDGCLLYLDSDDHPIGYLDWETISLLPRL